MKRTKIIATIGPATNTEEKIIALYKAGINTMRFNFSHANYKDTQVLIDIIKKLNAEGTTNLALLLDTKGPEIRTGDLEGENTYSEGDIFKVYVDSEKVKNKDLFCDYKYLAEDILVGQRIMLDSGLLEVEVLKKGDVFVEVKALNDAVIGSRRHVNLPGVRLKMPGVTQKDKEDILFGLKNGVSFIAASFIRNADNIHEIRAIFKENNCTTCKIISKVENQEAIENIDEIVYESDGIMVARGDLGIEVPVEKLAVYQRDIVDKCKKSGRFVIVATHLLETMIENPFPTRAETSDVFNSVLQGVDSLMLSGETAVGKFPIQTVELMTKIITEAEKTVEYSYENFSDRGLTERDIEKKLLIKSGIYIGEKLNVAALVVLTKTGKLAKLTAGFNPKVPVYAFTDRESSVGGMSLYFGVNAVFLKSWNKEDYEKTLENAIYLLRDKGIINNADKVVVVNDIQKKGVEIPVMEIINMKDF